MTQATSARGNGLTHAPETRGEAGQKPLPPRQLAALEVLMRGGTQEEAAKAGRVTERTVRNWLRRPAFRDAQRTARIRMLREVTTSLHINAPGAVQTMVAIRDDPGGRATDRLAASRTLIESMLRAAEKADLSECLEELESILAALVS